jgi:D-serine deaminase-like pyridoxal phosphate-dependent protein
MEKRDEDRDTQLGKNIHELDSPVAILDLAILKRNCNRMLESVKALDVGFRAHIKTHKVRDSLKQLLYTFITNLV